MIIHKYQSIPGSYFWGKEKHDLHANKFTHSEKIEDIDTLKLSKLTALDSTKFLFIKNYFDSNKLQKYQRNFYLDTRDTRSAYLYMRVFYIITFICINYTSNHDRN